MTNKNWILEVEEDPDTGDAIIQFPPDLLEATGWREGDHIKWIDLGNGSYQLEKTQLTDEPATPEEEEAWLELERQQKSKDNA